MLLETIEEIRRLAEKILDETATAEVIAQQKAGENNPAFERESV